MWIQVLAVVWLWLAIAMVLGSVIGWWIKKLGSPPAVIPEETATLKLKLKTAREEYETCTANREELEARVGDLEKALVSSKSRTAELENRMRVMEAEKAKPSVTVAAPVKTTAVAAPAEEVATPVVSEAVDTIGAAWESLAQSMDNDDLEEIHGVGPKLAPLLQNLGIHTFQQIALWKDSDIDQIEEKLEEFKGRIRREGWVESAKACHWRKYHESIGGYAPPPES